MYSSWCAGSAGVAGDQRLGCAAASSDLVLGTSTGKRDAREGAMRSEKVGRAVLVAAVQRVVSAAAGSTHGRGGGAGGIAAKLRVGRARCGRRHGPRRASARAHESRRAASPTGAAHLTQALIL